MSCFVCFGSAQDGGEGKKQVADSKDVAAAAARKDGPPPPPDRRGVVVGSGASRVWLVPTGSLSELVVRSSPL
jgi:hypothetical protein